MLRQARAACDSRSERSAGVPACHRFTYIRPVERCAVCGANRSYRTRKRVCSECRGRPHTTCATCDQPAAIPAAGEQAQCSHCRQGSPEPCEACGDLTISRTRQGRPRCQRCYQRPVGTCGRCGRVRAIVRLAVDGDPDLCAICWTGPTVNCENCGKVRPCRGERRGRMLCGACAPVRAAGMRALRSSATSDGALAGGAGVRQLLRARARGQGGCPECGETRRLMHYTGREGRSAVSARRARA